MLLRSFGCSLVFPLPSMECSVINMSMSNATNALIQDFGTKTVPVVQTKYVLYARKSTESEEKQVLSIDSQIKEMLQLAEREGLEIVAMKRESHSAKETGCRPVFNEIIEEIYSEKYNGILTWAPDRISRNAGGSWKNSRSNGRWKTK